MIFDRNPFSISLISLVVALSVGSAFGQLEIVNSLPNQDLPIRVELRNFDSADWVTRSEIEVTNLSSKRIPYVMLWLIFDVKNSDGKSYGLTLQFGDIRFYSTEGVLMRKDEKSILPGEKHVFQIRDGVLSDWELQLDWLTKARSAELTLGLINFGDGTVIMSCSNSHSPQVRVCSQTFKRK